MQFQQQSVIHQKKQTQEWVQVQQNENEQTITKKRVTEEEELSKTKKPMSDDKNNNNSQYSYQQFQQKPKNEQKNYHKAEGYVKFNKFSATIVNSNGCCIGNNNIIQKNVYDDGTPFGGNVTIKHKKIKKHKKHQKMTETEIEIIDSVIINSKGAMIGNNNYIDWSD